MSLTESEDTLKLWNHKFEFCYTVTLTLNTLTSEAHVENKGTEEFDLTFCFHTYLRVNNIADVKIKGLHSLTYVDKTQKDIPSIVEENRVVAIDKFVDRVYEASPDTVHIMIGDDKTIEMTKHNLRDYVMWNPWSVNAEKMSDMDNDGYLHMICVEAAQASERSIVKPGDTWKASQLLSHLT